MNWKFWKKDISEPAKTLAKEFQIRENWNQNGKTYIHRTKNVELQFDVDLYAGIVCVEDWMTWDEKVFFGKILRERFKQDRIQAEKEKIARDIQERQRITKELGV